MDFARRESLVVRIGLGRVNCGKWMVVSPTLRQRDAACQLYDEVLESAKSHGCLNADECRQLLLAHNLWSKKDDKRLEELAATIEDLKVGMLEFVYRETEREASRKAIRKFEVEQLTLLRRQNQWFHVTAEGVASQAKTNFILLSGVRPTKINWDKPFDFMDELISLYNTNMLGEADFRELARTEPWRAVWNASPSATRIFGRPAIKLTDEQKTLCAWSKLYDDVRNHSESPSQQIIDDDDMLDGWLIKHNRKRAAEEATSEMEGRIAGNEKIANADEVFLVAGSRREADRIYSANSQYAKTMVRQKLEKVKNEGVVSDVDMPDTRRKLQVEINKKR